MKVTYWNRAVETLDRPSLEKLQLERLREILGFALKTPFYGARLRENGISSPADLKDLDGLRAIPFTVKDDLRSAIVIHPHVELCEPGSLPVFEGKARRVVDSRPRM